MQGVDAIRQRDSLGVLSPAFRGDHAWCAERMTLTEGLEGGVPARVFFREGGLKTALDRLASRHGIGDRRVLCSFWSLYYFAGLTIPLILAHQLAGQALPVRLDDVSLALDDSGLPRTFGLAHGGKEARSSDPMALIADLTDDHLQDVVEHMQAQGLSRRLCWNNAAVYIDYALRLCGVEPPAGAANLLPFSEKALPDGRRNPFFGLLCRETDFSGETVARRKLCCLRYRLPAIGGCGAICALPCQRRPA